MAGVFKGDIYHKTIIHLLPGLSSLSTVWFLPWLFTAENVLTPSFVLNGEEHFVIIKTSCLSSWQQQHWEDKSTQIEQMQGDFLGSKQGIFGEKKIPLLFSVGCPLQNLWWPTHSWRPCCPTVMFSCSTSESRTNIRRDVFMMLSTCHVSPDQGAKLLQSFSGVSLSFSFVPVLPVALVEESLKLPPEQFQQRYDVRAPGKEDDNIVFYCRSGKRSFTALSTAHRLGFSR